MKKQKSNTSKLTCPNCGSSSKRNSTVLSKQVQYLVRNKLPWYAWNQWLNDILDKKEVKQNSILDYFLKDIKSQPGLIQRLKQGHFEWACDHCLETGRAIEGKVAEQTFCDNPPYLAYLDKKKNCETCSKNYIFSKEEQKFWYEELKFWVQSTPKNCQACRKEIRNKKNLNTKLSKLIKHADLKDANQLIEISQLYFEMGKVEKGKKYATLAKKAMKIKK